MRLNLSYNYRPVILRSLFIACLSLAIPLSAAYSQTGVVENGLIKATSRLVSLDITVLDAKGNPVTDLKESDFIVYENGELQKTKNFERFNAHNLPPTLTASSVNGTADLERLAPNAPVTILVLDEFNTEFSDNAYARQQLKRYLLAQPAVLKQPTTFIAATDAGFQKIQNYTLDRQLLLNSLAHLPAALPGSLMRTGSSSEGVEQRFAQTLDSLQKIAKACVGHKGRKNVIWVGRGFDSLDLRNETGYATEMVKGATERTVNLLQEAHVTVFTVDPTISSKLIADLDDTATANDLTSFAAEAHNPKDPFNGTVSFNTIAPLTGGRSFALNNDIDKEIQTSVEEGSAYYSLAYVPTASVDAAQPYRRIDVKLTRPGLKVITRHGYYSVTPPPPVVSARQERKAEGYDIGTAISSGITFTGIAVSAVLSPAKPGQCTVQVATHDIQWGEKEEGIGAHVELVAVSLDAHGKPVAHAEKDVVAKLKNAAMLDQMPFVTLFIGIPEGKNAKILRIAVHDTATGKLGTAEVALPTAK